MKKALLIFSVIAVILFSCKKDTDTSLLTGDDNTIRVENCSWYGVVARVFDKDGGEYDADPPFYYSRLDWWYAYKNDSTFIKAMRELIIAKKRL